MKRAFKTQKNSWYRALSLCLVFFLMISMCMPASAAAVDVNKDVSVYVIGDYDFSESVLATSNVHRSRESVSNEDAVTKPGAIVISKNMKDGYLTERTTELTNYLAKGNIVYFPELTYSGANILFDKIINNGFNMTPVDPNNNDKITAYVFMDEYGTYYTGCIIAPGDSGQVITDGLIIEETQKNQEIISRGKAAPAQVRASGTDFSIGYEWNALCSWHKNTYAGDITNYSWFSEWLCFYSTNASGDHYYAFAGEWSAEGSWTRLTDKIKYQSDGNLYQSGVLLRDYEPKMTPSTSEASFSCSIDSDSKYNFGFSQSWSISNLKLTDNTSSANDYCKLTWQLSGSMARNTCTGKFFMIFKDENESGSYKFHHYRYADQTHSDQYDEISCTLTSQYSFIG